MPSLQTEDRTPAQRRKTYDAVKKDSLRRIKAEKDGESLDKKTSRKEANKVRAKLRKSDAQTIVGGVKDRDKRAKVYRAGQKAASKTGGGRAAVRAAGQAATEEARKSGLMPRKRTAANRKRKQK